MRQASSNESADLIETIGELASAAARISTELATLKALDRDALAGAMVARQQMQPRRLPVMCDIDRTAKAKRYMKARQRRNTLFGSDIFADPAWDILLDLFVAEMEGVKTCVSSACIASGVPATTGVRWIRQLERLELVERSADPNDGRRVFVHLTHKAKDLLGAWLDRAFEELPAVAV